MPEKGERILYPCYFNATLTRKEGRRVPRLLGMKNPTPADLERALRKCGIQYRVELHHHPVHWSRREGRLVALSGEKKQALIRKVAQKLEARA
jgi:signal recognition particle subunit SRP19